MTPEDPHDVVIVGSGAGGAMAAWMLTKSGATVLMLEAGREYNPDEAPMLNMAMEAPLRGTGTKDKPFGYYDATVDGGWEVPGEPYTKAEGSDFIWWRSRMLGGRTNHWARNSFRMGPYDFKPHTRDGLGYDWPISYEDLAPWYDKTEKLVGVYGTNTGLENHPSSGPGVLQTPPKFRVWETFLKAGGDAINIPVVPARRAVLTKKIDERDPCYWASSCGRGCGIGAAFQTTTSLITATVGTFTGSATANPPQDPKTGSVVNVLFLVTVDATKMSNTLAGTTQPAQTASGPTFPVERPAPMCGPLILCKLPLVL